MRPAATSPLGGRTWIAFLALLAIVLLLRVIGLGHQSLWVDEADSFSYAKPDSPMTLRHIVANLHGPLHAIILHYWIKLAGTSEAALRFPSLVASVAAWIAFWFFARRAWGLRIAWIGGVLLAVAPFHIWYAQEARNYAFMILFAILAEWGFYRVLHEGPRGRLLLAYGAALLGGFLSNRSMAFLLLPQGVRLLLALRGGPPRLLPRVLAVWAVVALCMLPTVIWSYRAEVQPSHLLSTEEVPEEERLRSETTDSPLGIPYTFYSFATGYSWGPSRREMWELGPWQAVRDNLALVGVAALVFGFLWISGIVRTWKTERRTAVWLLLWQLLPLIALYFLAWRNVKVVNPRYAAIAFPAFIATVAHGVPGRRLGMLALGAAVVISLCSVGYTLMDPKYQKEDYRAAAHWLEQTLEPGDAYLSVAVDLPLRHYYLRAALQGKRPVPWSNLGKVVVWKGRISKRYATEVLPAWTPGRRLFVVLARPWVTDPHGELEAELRRQGRLLQERAWNGVRVLVLERRALPVTEAP